MKKLSRKKIMAIFIYLGCLFILTSTNPNKLPLSVLLAVLSILFAALIITVRWALVRIYGQKGDKLSAKRLKYLSVLIAGFPFLCVLLQSVGQFSLRDLAILVVFFGMLWFYLSRSQVLS